MSIVDLTNISSSDLRSPASAIADYESDNVRRDDKQPEGEVEFIGNTVASGFVGDAVIIATLKNSGIKWYIFLIYSFESNCSQRSNNCNIRPCTVTSTRVLR